MTETPSVDRQPRTDLPGTRFFEPQQNLYIEGWSRGWTVSEDYRWPRGTGGPGRGTDQERGGPGGWPPQGS